MKKLFISLAFILLLSSNSYAQSYEYKFVTTIESIVPGGLGRSRMITTEEVRNYADFTSSRTDGKEKKDERNKSKRSDIRLKNFDETKLLNFFNLGGIRFQNIAANDALVTSKLNALGEEGWELAFVASGVESKGDKSDNNGLFITRYIFKRKKQ